MNPIILTVTVLLPVLGGALIPLLPFRSRRQMLIYIETVVLINTALVLTALLNRPADGFVLFHLNGKLSISFQLDGLGTVFAAIVSLLWPLATLYAFEYMTHEGHEKYFFMFYTITYGITLGIAFAEDIVTMYCFYEILTLVTLPLILHTLSREAILAGRTYLYYSLGGAAFAFIGMIFILNYGSTANFSPGGVLMLARVGDSRDLLLLIYVLCFFGFSVKAGAFTLMRITYYSFGASFLRGTWAQTVVMVFVLITIVYGCSRALKETHLKRRLAYSTMSNLSYILFGVVLMSPLGLTGALCHMIFHAVMKICSFFCAGAVIYKSGRNYIHELDGMGRKMPKVFGAFTVSAFALMGVPGLCGFISKWNLAKAAVDNPHPLAIPGVAALLISALLTAIYMLTIVVRAFFPGKDFDYRTLDGITDPTWRMLLPLGIFVVLMILFGLHSAPVVSMLSKLAAAAV